MTAEVRVDGSCLPPVQEVCRDFAVLEDEALAYCLQEQEMEQHYASNVQKSRLVQKDLRVARRLQDLEWEAAKIQVPRQQKQREERYSRRDWEEKEWRDSEGYQNKKAEEGKQETAPRRLRDSEEERSHRPRTGSGEGRKETLSRREEERAMWSREQLWQDEALARKVQEEERSRLRAQRKQEQRGDYRAAQVAQDEEIACYIQDQELKARWRRPSQELGTPSGRETRSLSELKWKSPSSNQEEAQQSQEGRYVPARATTQARSLERPEGPARGGHVGSGRHPFCRNIAEELDPTFRAKGPEHPPPEAFAPCPQAALAPAPTRPLPLDGLFDYPDADAALPFVSPTKHRPEKVGHQKPRDKREGCKQQ